MGTPTDLVDLWVERAHGEPGLGTVVNRVLGDMLPSVTCGRPPDDEPTTPVVERSELPLTTIEREVLGLVPAALEDLRSVELATTAVSRAQLLEELLVTRLLARRTGGEGAARATGTVLAAMRELSAQQEEGRAATSGVIVVDDVDGWLARAARDGLVHEPFAVELDLDRDFFSRPAAHHYVDGRHSFYLVGPDLSVAGLVRIGDQPAPPEAGPSAATPHLTGEPRTLESRIDRLLDPGGTGEERSWCATVDGNSTLNVFAGEALHLRRRSSHWRLLDRGLLPGCLRRAGMSAPDAEVLSGALTTLSDARTGTLLLVPTTGRTPALAGIIDSSRCGAALLTHLVGRSVQDLWANRALLGILACDGMTMVAPDGELLLTGAIIDLHQAPGSCSGGGRTHAGASASGSGLAVMVSADGQITVFEHGRQLLHLER